MGEDSTAGQVGGMEATKEVRCKVAQSSRKWRCEACGGRTNEEVMQEWWEICRAKGVKFGEEVGLEELPEALKLGFKDELKEREQEKAKSEESPLLQVGSKSVQRVINTASGPAAGSGQQLLETASLNLSRSAEASNSLKGTSKQPTSSPREDSSQSTQPTRTVPPPDQSTSTPILDKAISGLFVALFLMVLKKILYNHNVTQDY